MLIGTSEKQSDAQPTPQALRSHRFDIQGLRAVAVLAVVIYHAGLPIPGGFVGVDVFFVISGFVITAMVLREWRRTGKFNLVRFYFKRFKRLTPALALVVSVVAILAFFLLSPMGTQQDAARTGIGAMLLSANLVIGWITGDYFGATADTNVFLHTWSLAVEEQFYLIFPLLLFGLLLASRRFVRNKMWVPVAGIGIVAALSLFVMLLGFSGYGMSGGVLGMAVNILLGFYSPVVRSWEFAAGAVLALLGDRIVPRRKGSAELIAWLGAGLLVASFVVITVNTRFPGPITFLPVVGTMALLVAGSGQQTPLVTRALATKPMVLIGDWSYSIYLWHWPLIVLVTSYRPGLPAWMVPAAAIFSFVPAALSYRYVESPVRALKVTNLRSAVVLIATFVSIPLLLCLTLLQAANAGFWNPRVQAFQREVFAAPEISCASMQPLSRALKERCTWNVGAAGDQIYLVGDSNAAHFADGMVAAAQAKGRPITIATGNGCPFLSGGLTRQGMTGAWSETCTNYSERSLEFLSSAAPGLVVISNFDSYWYDPKIGIGQGSGPVTSDEAQKTQMLRSALAQTVQKLRASGHEVLLVQTVPRWIGDDQWTIEQCTIAEVADGGCVQTMPLSHAEARQGAVRGHVRQVAESEGARVLDTWPMICEGDECSTQADGFARYKDSGHISVEQSKALAGEFARYF